MVKIIFLFIKNFKIVKNLEFVRKNLICIKINGISVAINYNDINCKIK